MWIKEEYNRESTRRVMAERPDRHIGWSNIFFDDGSERFDSRFRQRCLAEQDQEFTYEQKVFDLTNRTLADMVHNTGVYTLTVTIISIQNLQRNLLPNVSVLIDVPDAFVGRECVATMSFRGDNWYLVETFDNPADAFYSPFKLGIRVFDEEDIILAENTSAVEFVSDTTEYTKTISFTPTSSKVRLVAGYFDLISWGGATLRFTNSWGTTLDIFDVEVTCDGVLPLAEIEYLEGEMVRAELDIDGVSNQDADIEVKIIPDSVATINKFGYNTNETVQLGYKSSSAGSYTPNLFSEQFVAGDKVILKSIWGVEL